MSFIYDKIESKKTSNTLNTLKYIWEFFKKLRAIS